MNNSDDYIRSFGMSGYLITDEISSLESSLNLELGHTEGVESVSTVDYYPQFEQSVRAEAASMANHYEVFYCLEQAIRKLITETLYESVGAQWWTGGCIPQAIVQDVSARGQKEVDNGFTRRSEHPIDYTTFGELSVIITANWNLFGAIFSSRRAVEKIMSNLNVLRGPIAHCCPLGDDEVDRLELTVKDWFRNIG